MSKKIKIVSFNINGINSAIRDGILEFMAREDADIYCFQEVKSNPENATNSDITMSMGYEAFWNPAKRKGYSGVMFYTKIKPLAVIYGMGIEEFDDEGRIITAEYEKFILVNSYFPNSQHELKRLDYKLRFNEEFLKFVKKLEKDTGKPVVLTGDFNVAHKEIDLTNPKSNEKNPGFSKEERESFTQMLKHGLKDSFRELHPGLEGAYTWWSYRFKARERNIGWRIDYFVISEKLMKHVKESEIILNIPGSDHAPIRLILEL